MIPFVLHRFCDYIQGLIGIIIMDDTVVKSLRMPQNTWLLLEIAAKKQYRSVNSLIRKLAEDYLVESELISEEKRKYPQINEIIKQLKEDKK